MLNPTQRHVARGAAPGCPLVLQPRLGAWRGRLLPTKLKITRKWPLCARFTVEEKVNAHPCSTQPSVTSRGGRRLDARRASNVLLEWRIRCVGVGQVKGDCIDLLTDLRSASMSLSGEYR